MRARRLNLRLVFSCLLLITAAGAVAWFTVQLAPRTQQQATLQVDDAIAASPLVASPLVAGPPPTLYIVPPDIVYLPQPSDLGEFITIAPTVLPPIPTQMPTPYVTPIPLAQFPVVQPPGDSSWPYSILFRNGNDVGIADAGGANPRILVNTADAVGRYPPRAYDMWAAPSPDGERAALFLSNLDISKPWRRGDVHQFNIYLLDLKSGELSLLVENGTETAWSPDGKWIAYAGKEGLWLVSPATGETRQIYASRFAEFGRVAAIQWAHDSRHIAFLDILFKEDQRLIAMDIDNSHSAVTLAGGRVTFWPGEARWSPNDQSLLYGSYAENTTLPDRLAQALWVVQPSGGEAQRLNPVLDNMGYDWSPDGQWIAVTGFAPFEDTAPYYDLWLLHAVTGELKRLTQTSSEQDMAIQARWAPDGTHIVYFRQPDQVWQVDLTTGEHTQLPFAATDFIVVPQ
jgi:Tol biopolymer transport system component